MLEGQSHIKYVRYPQFHTDSHIESWCKTPVVLCPEKSLPYEAECLVAVALVREDTSSKQRT